MKTLIQNVLRFWTVRFLAKNYVKLSIIRKIQLGAHCFSLRFIVLSFPWDSSNDLALMTLKVHFMDVKFLTISGHCPPFVKKQNALSIYPSSLNLLSTFI